MRRRRFASAVIVAAGASLRMGQNKAFMELAGEPVILRTLRAFEASPVISEIIAVCREEDMERVAQLASESGITKLAHVVIGGASRPLSVYNGLQAVSKKADIIAIHDGARPLVTNEIIRDAVHKAEKYHAAAPAVAVKATVKEADNGVVLRTPPRERLFEAQTPQCFDADLIRAALVSAIRKKLAITDDCAAVEVLGCTVYLTEGSYENIKITTPEDLAVAEAIIARRTEVPAE
ncbi:MAG: 2-C-methyl-D-erythritol 4-phosphate cytidylyltransferase [Oscillospiraceae bacterium]|nr:2-C-methyl-D-erythritol 4-phosphate cytidylyltransferase [Oscillospiraceae bacterium]